MKLLKELSRSKTHSWAISATMLTSSGIQRKLKLTSKVHSMTQMTPRTTSKRTHRQFNKATSLKVVLFSEKAKEQWTLLDLNNNLWTNNRFSIKHSLYPNSKIECKAITIPIWIQTEFKSLPLMSARILIWRIKVSIQLRINNFNNSNNFWCNNHITWLNNKKMRLDWTKSKNSTSSQI